VTNPIAVVLFLSIIGLVVIDMTFAEGRNSLFAARQFVGLIEGVAFWR